ncbi:murein transglycosylase A [Hyphobacterium sp.]|uniref:murein transglycosylase A n=1 Tax=Hyphobacterium sp. TaxID=2004662 RepID=UPI003BA8C129
MSSDLIFEALDWADIETWTDLDLGPAYNAFVRSCVQIAQSPGGLPLSPRTEIGGTLADWQPVCAQRSGDDIRGFFETHFQPVRVRSLEAESGLLTGYYEPEVLVRRLPEGEYTQPIRSRPVDLLIADLGAFSEEFSGQRLVGRAEGSRFVPYRERAEIEASNAGQPLAWGRPIDVFFLQIQGSGRLVFNDGETVRAAFAAHNGRPYASIGRELVQRGELELHAASKSGIEAWLNENGPEATAELFAVNPRYVFFGLEPLPDPNLGPRGAANLPLTPMGSIAVDPAFLPYGVPVIVSADLPDEPGWQGLLVTQDTGGAIRGPMRGDLFYGWGETAERRAGSTRSQSEWIILLPHAVAARLTPPA